MTWSTTQPTIDPLWQNHQDCEEALNKTSAVANGNDKYCKGTWDGWSCWPDTLAGSSAYALCPDFITGFDPTRFAHKECGSDGVWFIHPSSNKTWSNYTTCVNLDDLEWRQQVNLIYETGYAISLIALLPSLAILFYFRSLKCARITIHINLFAYRVVLGRTDVIARNESGCIVLHLVLHYFLMTSYAWMLCEGFYLHTVLVSAFISEQRLVRWLMVFGWSSPAIVLTVYGFSRGFHGNDEDRDQCWMNETLYTNVLVAPVCVSMLLNLLFLCNIVRVLVLKLHLARKEIAVLHGIFYKHFGLQYILTPFKPEPGHSWERLYETISAFTASFQGLCVATLFCFCNGEVIAQIKRKWRSLFFSNRARSNSYTATQVSSGCIVLHLVLHYFLMTSYAWMLCEGFYLHTVLVSAFISEQRLVRWLMVFGWSSPAIVLTVYGFSRGFHGNDEDRDQCWMNETLYTNVLVAPVCVSMLLNLLFLCNIVRVLVLKLKAPLGPQENIGPSRNILQAFRATLLLVPLLGLQYILTPFKPEPGHSWERLYETISAFTASFQGLCVATLFCFCNGEVIAQIKRKWRSLFFSNRARSNSYTATQVSFVRCGPPVPGEVKV